jgi:uncharacterized membrane protein YdjX (TVP38/TMEM64 family)
MSSEPRAAKKIPWVKLAIATVVLAVGAVLLLCGLDVPALIERTMDLIRRVGPVGFFLAMTILPTAAVPLSLFTIPAGEAFAPQMGLGVVIAISLVVLAVNMALTYWVARYALRPALTKLLQRYGYTVPRVTPENALAITLVMRVTPGTPYVIQGYVLGIAEVPFVLYMIVSWLCQAPWVVGFVVLGQGLLKGNFAVAAKGLGVIVAVVIAVQWLRRKYAKREG